MLEKIYTNTPSNRMSISTDPQIISEEVLKLTGYTPDKIKLEKTNIPNIEKEIQLGRRLGVRGTPAIFINGISSTIEDIK